MVGRPGLNHERRRAAGPNAVLRQATQRPESALGRIRTFRRCGLRAGNSILEDVIPLPGNLQASGSQQLGDSCRSGGAVHYPDHETRPPAALGLGHHLAR
eukprot:10386653-Alexandrium_andersonii.AAC.1